MVEEAERVTVEARYWKAVRAINAGRGIAEATKTLIEIASSAKGSVAKWAKQTLTDKLGCQLTTAS